jgi:hypothetical protein
MTRNELRELVVLKQLLIAESAVNRTRLREDLAELRAEAEALAEEMTSMGALATLAARWLDGTSAAPAQQPAGRPRHGWLRSLIDAGGLALQVWRTYAETRARTGKREPEQPEPHQPEAHA